MSVYSLSTLPKSVSIDRALIPKSYRDYLDILKGMGELIEIDDEVDRYLELGAIFRHSAETLEPPLCAPGLVLPKCAHPTSGVVLISGDADIGKTAPPCEVYRRVK